MDSHFALSKKMVDMFKKHGQSDDLNIAIAHLKATLKEMTELATKHLTDYMGSEFQNIQFSLECCSWACNIALEFYNPETQIVEIPEFYFSKAELESIQKAWDNPLSQFQLRGHASSNSIMAENKVYSVRDEIKEMVWQSYRGMDVKAEGLIEAPKNLRVTVPNYNASVCQLFIGDRGELNYHCKHIADSFLKQKIIDLKKINQQTLDL